MSQSPFGDFPIWTYSLHTVAKPHSRVREPFPGDAACEEGAGIVPSVCPDNQATLWFAHHRDCSVQTPTRKEIT